MNIALLGLVSCDPCVYNYSYIVCLHVLELVELSCKLVPSFTHYLLGARAELTGA